MKESLLELQASSVLELDIALSTLKQNQNGNVCPVILNLFGPQMLVRQFELPRLSPKEVHNALKLEAAELFTLLPDAIEIDYQVLDTSSDKIRGIFVGLPKMLLEDYLSCLDKLRCLPEKVTANIFSRMNYFLNEDKTKGKNFCIVDFFKVVYSLKFVTSKSSCKQFDEIYILGSLSNKKNIVLELERALRKNLCNSIEQYEPEIPLDIFKRKGLFDIDLSKKYTFPYSLRQKIFRVTNVLLLSLTVLSLFFAVNFIRYQTAIKKLSTSFDEGAYMYAQILQKELTSLKNVK